MSSWAYSVIGACIALLAVSFGVTGNVVISLLAYGVAIFFLGSPKTSGLWYLGSLTLVADLLGTQRLGLYLILATLTYLVQYFFVEQLRFTSRANRRSLAIFCTVIGGAAILCHAINVQICLITALSLLILICINYLLPDQPNQLSYVRA